MKKRSSKTKRKRHSCGLCKPHKMGGTPQNSSKGTKHQARELADLEDVRAAHLKAEKE